MPLPPVPLPSFSPSPSSEIIAWSLWRVMLSTQRGCSPQGHEVERAAPMGPQPGSTAGTSICTPCTLICTVCTRCANSCGVPAALGHRPEGPEPRGATLPPPALPPAGLTRRLAAPGQPSVAQLSLVPPAFLHPLSLSTPSRQVYD